MGGSGGGGYQPVREGTLDRIRKVKEQEGKRLLGQIDELLKEYLAGFNDRDREGVKNRLDSIQKKLEGIAEIETILFGGSVAKHTDVDGMSDVDALVILDKEGLQGQSPSQILESFHETLDARLPKSEIKGVEIGTLAVTVTYKDDQEIQLLPALRTGNRIRIATSGGEKWNETRPRVFLRELSKANANLNFSLVPSIKLAKSIIFDFPENKRISGYHLEAIAVDAARNYDGPKNPRRVLLHLLDHASKRVRQPIQDVTQQQRTIDNDLGKAGSPRRQEISRAFAGVKKRLETTTTVHQWKVTFETTE